MEELVTANQAVIKGATLVYKGNQIEYIVDPSHRWPYYLITPVDKNLLSPEEFKKLPKYYNFEKAVDVLIEL